MNQLRFLYGFNTIKIEWDFKHEKYQHCLKEFVLKKNNITIYQGSEPFFVLKDLKKGEKAIYTLTGQFESFWSKWEDKICNRTFTVPNFEVYSLELDLLNSIKNYSPKSQKLEEKFKHVKINSANVFLAGGVGSGKSSIVNTFDTCLQNSGKISRQVRTLDWENHVSKKFSCHDFNKLESETKIKLFDAWGWVPKTNHDKLSISSMLGGKLPLEFEIGKDPMEKLIQNPTLNDSIHCVVFLVDYKNYDKDDYYEKFRDFREVADDKEIPYLVVITKCDETDNKEHDTLLKQNYLKIYESHKLNQIRCTVSEKSGVKPGDIYFMINYSIQYSPKKEINNLALNFLSEVLSCCDTYYSKLYVGTAQHSFLQN
eukprot:TRINITY_DN15936_c0_g1_i1.p1 TRINITY_DN15936_c0_g1~~TRINITY_DN15936_c0_g1_i1.p1  ORF type:complete len:370 (-),score=66.19 TRINITY_DN15936_c0_g1_i1:8-1117(-)